MSDEVEDRLLHWLLRLPLLRLDDLFPLVGSSRATVARHIAACQQRGLVTVLSVAGALARPSGHSHAYYLTHAGVLCQARQAHIAPLALARAWQADEVGLLRWYARLTDWLLIQDFLQGLLRNAPAQIDVSGEWIWGREYRYRVPALDRRRHVARADAAFVLYDGEVARQRGMGAFILLDQTIPDWARAKRWLTGLTALRESAERWMEYPRFPPLLILATSERHMEHWQIAILTVAHRMQAPPLQGAMALMTAGRNPWEAPWRSLVTRHPCRLAQVLTAVAAAPLEVGMAVGNPQPPTASSRRHVVRNDLARRIAQVVKPATLPEIRMVSGDLPHTLLDLLDQLALSPRIALHQLVGLLDVAETTVERNVREVVRRGLAYRLVVEHVVMVGLTPIGVRVVAARHGVHPHASVLAQAARLPKRADSHEAGIYRFCAQFAETVRVLPQGRLVWWETAARCAHRWQDGDGKWHNLRPDAAGLMQVASHRYRWWLEWDTGTMDRGDLAEKFATYAAYLRAEQWRRFGAPPLLLCVTPRRGQFDALRQVATQVLPEQSEVHFAAYVTLEWRLQEVGPFAPIWASLRMDGPLMMRRIFDESGSSLSSAG